MDESVTVTAVHTVAYGREADFFAWVNSLLLHAETSPDFLGGGLLGPPEAGGEWHVIYRWVDQESALWWEDVTASAAWVDRAEAFAQPTQVQQITGLRAWFEKRAQAPTPPPKWKMAIVTLTAVFPPVLLFNVAIIPRLLGLPVVLRTLVLCIGVTVAVTWVMMPRLTRLLKGWLQPPASGQSSTPPVQLPRIASPQRTFNSARTVNSARTLGPARTSGPAPRRPGRHAATDPEQWSPDDRPVEREALTHRPSVGTGRRPVLNLVRDGDVRRPPYRRPPSPDPRSSHLRRETG